MEETIVLFPSPGMQGHLAPMVELAKLILTHHPTFSITILVSNPPPNSDHQHPTSAFKNINFHRLSPISDHDTLPNLSSVEHFFDLPRLHNPNVRKILQSLSEKTKIRAFVIDIFCDAAFEVSAALNIPTYYFITFGGGGLALLLYLRTIDSQTGKSIKDMEFPISVPGLPLIAPSDIPVTIQDRTTIIFKYFLNTSIHLAESSGIIVNTCEALEERCLKALRDGLCVPEKPTPPIFCIGPVISSGNSLDGRFLISSEEEYCLSWLDRQPSKSVVLLCFGSMGFQFPSKQLYEMAVGLEKSGQKFLWVVRDPPEDEKMTLEDIFPNGFLEKTEERGLVVRKWAPQAKILSHDSVGGFVTHCGWNSVLESVCAGVPMVAWPLYAEQRLNRLVLVEAMRVALAVSHDEPDGLVSGAELEERVRELMDSESERGREVRERVLMMRDAAVNAMRSGGSSHLALTKLTEQWKQNDSSAF